MPHGASIRVNLVIRHKFMTWRIGCHRRFELRKNFGSIILIHPNYFVVFRIIIVMPPV